MAKTMPVDKAHHRGGDGRNRDALGQPTLWNCPGCGKKVEGVRVEMGCPHCGAGKPQEAPPATPPRPPDTIRNPTDIARAIPPKAQPPVRPPLMQPSVSATAATPSRRKGPDEGERAVEPLRVLRLIEYLIADDANLGVVLRNSLVGTINMGWGSITATIVDDATDRQEDLLRLAKRQPGVWLANPEAMEARAARQALDARPGPPAALVAQLREHARSRAREIALPVQDVAADAADHYAKLGATRAAGGDMDPDEIARLVQALTELLDDRTLYTVALALTSFAPALADTDEPDRVLAMADCEALGAALLARVPDDTVQEPLT